MKTVYVVGGDRDIEQMFESRGWITFTHPGTVGGSEPFFDLVCFTGGADVHPSRYGEEPDGNGYYNEERDEFECDVFHEFVGKVPMVGICRGGQFLNVMNGGKLIQHIPAVWFGQSPVSGDIVIHEILPCPVDEDGCGDAIGCQGHCYKKYEVRVDHHQAMVPTNQAKIIHNSIGGLVPYTIYYKDTSCLCFQPHPEWGHEPTKELFFDLIQEYIG